MTRPTLRPRLSIFACAAAVCAVAALSAAACGNFTGVPASLPTISDTGTVFALNGAPPGAPTALHVFSGALTSADANFIFDVAFDIDPSGTIVVLPQRAVASGLAATHTVSLQKDTVNSFDQLTRAPANGYRADTAMTIKPNQVILVQSADANACGVSLTGTTIYAKIVITAVDKAARQLAVKYTTDPNCGFRSFATGIPKD
ncbi:MAG TPA: hypothetical protein VN706_09615 [Gemmatimonadaceae bacterium]|nr:hypothetical protein [Gemmatimonadaceae bacterium]